MGATVVTPPETSAQATLRPYQVVVLRVTAAIFTYLGVDWFAAYWAPGQEEYGQTHSLVKAAVFLVLAGLLVRPYRLGVVVLWFIAVDRLAYCSFFLFREIAPHPGLILGVVIYSPYVIMLALPTADILADWLRWGRRVWGRHTSVDRRPQWLGRSGRQ